jgi:hypothetical protein
MAGAASVAGGAPPSVIPAVPPDPLVAWDQVLHALHSHKRTLAGAYEHARVLAWTADVIDIGFSVDWHMFGEIARDTLPEMKTFLKGLLGRPVDLRVKLLDETESKSVPARSVVESNRDKQFEEKRKRESEAREHPVTKLVLETFGASIKEIKTDV